MHFSPRKQGNGQKPLSHPCIFNIPKGGLQTSLIIRPFCRSPLTQKTGPSSPPPSTEKLSTLFVHNSTKRAKMALINQVIHHCEQVIHTYQQSYRHATNATSFSLKEKLSLADNADSAETNPRNRRNQREKRLSQITQIAQKLIHAIGVICEKKDSRR